MKRTHSPPIPTTAAVSSEYYRLAVRDANAARNELQGLGLEDGEDDEGGMVTGKSQMETTGRRHHARTGKKKGRRDRHQEAQRHPDEDDDDSSDLSDDSDEDGDNMQRWAGPFYSIGCVALLSDKIQWYRSDQVYQDAGAPGPSRFFAYPLE